MTHLDLRSIRVLPGEQFTDTVSIDLEPFELGGQTYAPEPAQAEGRLTITRTTSGLLFELDLDASLVGPCFRCLQPTRIATPVRGREYQASNPDDSDELQTPYVAENRLDLSTWARDAIALELPDKILCREDCAGLCPTCGRDLNLEPHEHEEDTTDPRWAALADLRDQL
jgi:DUF177 domain-containing protein